MLTEVAVDPRIKETLAAYKQAVELEKDLSLSRRIAFQLQRNVVARLMFSEPPQYAKELHKRLQTLLLEPPAEYPARTVFCSVDHLNRSSFFYGFELWIGNDHLGVGFQSPRLTIERSMVENPIIRVQGERSPVLLIPDHAKDRPDYSFPLIKSGVGSLKWAPDVFEKGPVSIEPEVYQETVWLITDSTYIHRDVYWNRVHNFPRIARLTVNAEGDLISTLATSGLIHHFKPT